MMWDSNDEIPIKEDKYQISVLHVDCQPDKARDTRLPRNAYMVSYMVNGVQKYDIVSGLKVDIFNCYYDKLGKDQSKTLNGPMEKSSQNFSTKRISQVKLTVSQA